MNHDRITRSPRGFGKMTKGGCKAAKPSPMIDCLIDRDDRNGKGTGQGRDDWESNSIMVRTVRTVCDWLIG